jgi:predicted protein tyrosine phosphatase
MNITEETQSTTIYKGIAMPTVRGIQDAAVLAPYFPSVITAGPSQSEVRWSHPSHCVEKFGDTEDVSSVWAPKFEQVQRLVKFGAKTNEPILIHCHAGISRSTATAIGVSIARGLAPKEAIEKLAEIHPADQWFCPNGLVLGHVETYFGLKSGSLATFALNFDRVPEGGSYGIGGSF